VEPRRAESSAPPAHSGPRESWVAGLVLGAIGGPLTLEFPFLGLAICVATAAIIWLRGRAGAGIGGLLVGAGGMWLALFGRVALNCRMETGCTAPDIGSAVAASAAILAAGLGLSIVAAIRARRG
jgi:hypothetical protein